MALNQLGLGLLFSATDLASGVMARVRTSFSQTRNEMGEFQVQSADAFKAFGTGIAVMGVGLGGLAGLFETTKAAGEFGTAIAEASTLIDEATFPVAKMEELTLGLAGAYGKVPTEEVKALYQAISSGATDASKATGVMNTANKLAIGGVTDVKTALDGLTNVLNSYGIAYENADTVSDAFFVAMRAGKTTVGELAATVGRLAPTAGAVGVGFETMLGSIAAVTTKGLKTEEAVSGLKAALANVIKPTKEAEDEAKRLGVEFTATALRAKGFPAFLKDISSSSKFTADSFSKFFGSIEGLNSILALTANGGDTFASILEQMDKRAGSTSDAFGKMSQTAKFQEDRFMALGTSAKIMIGKGFEPVKVAIFKAANAILEAFAKIPKPVVELGVKIFALASAAITLVGAFVAAKAAIVIAAAGLKFAGISLAGLLATLAPAIVAVGALGLAFYALKVAYDKNIGGLGDSASGLFDRVRLAVSAIGQLLTDGGFSGEVREAFEKPGSEGVRALAVNVFLWVERIKVFFSSMVDTFEATIGRSTGTFANFSRALGEMSDAFGIANQSSAQAASTYDAFAESGSDTGNVIARASTLMVAGMAAVMDIVTGAKTAWDGLLDVFAPITDAFGEIGDVIAAVMADLGLASETAGSSTSVWKTVGSVLSGVVGVAISFVGSNLRWLVDIFRNAATIFGGIVDVIGGIFTGNWGRVWKGMGRIVFGAVMYVVDLLAGLLNMVLDVVDGIGNAFGADLGIGKGFRGMREDFRSSFQESEIGGGRGVTGGLAPPDVGSQSISPSTSPGVAAAQSSSRSQAVDPALLEGITMNAAANTIAKMPPASFSGSLIMDGEKCGEVLLKATRSSGARSFVPTEPVAGD